MNRVHLFTLAVQTCALDLRMRPHVGPWRAPGHHAVSRAGHLPEEAIPKGAYDLAEAAEAFVGWVCRGDEKPKWLAEYEEAAERRSTWWLVELTDHAAAGWWQQADELREDAPPAAKAVMRTLVEHGRARIDNPNDLAAFNAWVVSLPAYDPEEKPMLVTVKKATA